jgi:hypothetical protein
VHTGCPPCRPSREECKQYIDLQRDAEAFLDEALVLVQHNRGPWGAAIQPGALALVRVAHHLRGTKAESHDACAPSLSTTPALILGTRDQLDELAVEDLERRRVKVPQRPKDSTQRDAVYVLALHDPQPLDETDARQKVPQGPGFDGLRARNQMWSPPQLPMCALLLEEKAFGRCLVGLQKMHLLRF